MKKNTVDFVMNCRMSDLKDLYEIRHHSFKWYTEHDGVEYEFNHTLYYDILEDLYKSLKRKWILIRFFNEYKIISKLRQFIDNYCYGGFGSCSTYKYQIKASISLNIKSMHHTEYMLHVYDIIRLGPYISY